MSEIFDPEAWYTWASEKIGKYLQTHKGPFQYKVPTVTGADREKVWQINWDKFLTGQENEGIAVPGNANYPLGPYYDFDEFELLNPFDPADTSFQGYNFIGDSLDGYYQSVVFDYSQPVSVGRDRIGTQNLNNIHFGSKVGVSRRVNNVYLRKKVKRRNQSSSKRAKVGQES